MVTIHMVDVIKINKTKHSQQNSGKGGDTDEDIKKWIEQMEQSGAKTRERQSETAKKVVRRECKEEENKEDPKDRFY